MPSLCDLPNELLTEFARYYPALYCPLQADAMPLGTQANDYTGVDTLRALAQTCVHLRAVFQPLLWRDASLYFEPRKPGRYGGTGRRRERKAERKLAALRRAVDVHGYIRSLTVTLHECTVDNWHPVVELARVLQCLPRLVTLVITGIRASAGSAKNLCASLMKTAFDGKTFPSVKDLTTDTNDTDIVLALESFPRLTALNMGDMAIQIRVGDLRLIAEYCPHIERLHNIWLPYSNEIDMLPELARALSGGFPKLRYLSLTGGITKECLQGLALCRFRHLEQLTLRYTERVPFTCDAGTTVRSIVPDALVEDLVAECGRILTASGAKNRRMVCIEFKQQSWMPRRDRIVETTETFHF
ncbi:hypothetical protein MIND_00646800 [Mycena indigotica]|uniref:Uncharacterized protein n=1 Tax=Mycena indigotica TaxID=2126181 RepID=A0A8H6ST01_9AGAR|nr:uncharacterized protein MIND_00646800 [Mycena indigotica]KAF7304151.1 hypothetical protein MIND_00646800 [Mycena indigotica]